MLHLDDNFAEIKKMRDALRDCAVQEGGQGGAPALTFDLVSANTREAFDAALAQSAPDVAIIDVRLSEEGEEGMAVVQRLRRENPAVVVIMCSSLDDVHTVKRSLRAGADDFLSKSCDRAHLALRVTNAYKLASLKRGLGVFADEAQAAGGAAGGIAKNVPAGGRTFALPVMAGATLRTVARRIPGILASAVTAVHIRGESGTGKEVVADMFAAGAGGVPFVKVNCGSISPSLLESELFGHARGAFTGATSEKRGYVEEASDGWLFLDEVALLSSSAQVALLRVLENGEIVRVGESKARKVNTRVVSACNEPLETLVAKGTFRRDLWQRLQELVIELPPLRERSEEIPALVEHFCATMAGGPYDITQTALDVLCEYDWREGNVRELRNCLRAMTSEQLEKLLTPLSIPERVWTGVGAGGADRANLVKASLGAGEPGARAVAPIEIESTPRRVRLVGPVPSETAPESFEHLSNLLFLECIRVVGGRERLPSMRALARALQLSPSTVPRRVQTLLAEGYVSAEELDRYLYMT